MTHFLRLLASSLLLLKLLALDTHCSIAQAQDTAFTYQGHLIAGGNPVKS